MWREEKGVDLLGEWLGGVGGEKKRKDAEQRARVGDRRWINVHLQQPKLFFAHPSDRGRAGELDTACSKTKQMKTPNMQHDTLKAFPPPFANPPKS